MACPLAVDATLRQSIVVGPPLGPLGHAPEPQPPLPDRLGLDDVAEPDGLDPHRHTVETVEVDADLGVGDTHGLVLGGELDDELLLALELYGQLPVVCHQHPSVPNCRASSLLDVLLLRPESRASFR
jgi:hypothetical protein